MLDAPVPNYVDMRNVFMQEGKIRGSIDLARLQRFRESLVNSHAEIYVELDFHLSESGQKVITGLLRATVNVSCQRCLEPLAIQLSDDIRLAIVSREDDIADLDEGWDAWICPDIKLVLASFIEEQLLLCMPIVSMHNTKSCNEQSKYSTAPAKAHRALDREVKENPFSVLKDFKALKENNVTD